MDRPEEDSPYTKAQGAAMEKDQYSAGLAFATEGGCASRDGGSGSPHGDEERGGG